MPDSYLLTRVRAVLPQTVLPLGTIAVVDGRIAAIGAPPEAFPQLEAIDGEGALVAPGFFDIHCHGVVEGNFLANGPGAAQALLENGTTSVLATVSYSEMIPGQLARQVETYWEGRSPLEERVVVGMHLEGPYINYKYGAGSHHCQPRDPQPHEYEEILARWGGSVVKEWTLAPELPGSGRFAEAAHRAGVVLAAGHTEAALKDLEPLIGGGLAIATHWSNATGRPSTGGGVIAPGIDEFTLENEAMFAELICDKDGRHVHPLLTRLLYKTKGPEGIVLITDSTRSRSQRDLAENPESDVNFTDEGQLCGSRLTMPGAARNFQRATGATLPEIFRMGALNPARIFGLDGEIGSIEVGKRANLIKIDDNFRVQQVWLA